MPYIRQFDGAEIPLLSDDPTSELFNNSAFKVGDKVTVAEDAPHFRFGVKEVTDIMYGNLPQDTYYYILKNEPGNVAERHLTKA